MVIAVMDDRFVALFRDPIPPFVAGHRIEGRIITTEGHIVTLAHL